MGNSEALWQELTVTALLGTQRKPYIAPDTAAQNAGGELAAALNDAALRPEEDGEKALLRAAALMGLYRRAGRVPIKNEAALPTICPQETWPRCSTKSGAHLIAIVSGDFIDLLPEWVELAARSGVRIREEILPEVLQHKKLVQPKLRSMLVGVLGERGRWLARQNPDWQEFDSFTDERIWQEGKRQERMAFLSDLRQSDPERARELLMMTWSQEASSDKAGFLKLLDERLSMGDEPFLENALDDRRKDVRTAAANMLRKLAGSRLVQRQTQRARQMVHWKSGLLKSSIEVKLPEACDEAMQRDGVEAKAPSGSLFGDKAYWLVQILADVPPVTWSGGWNKRPQQLLEMIRKHEWEEALLQGWQEAAYQFQDSEWLEALLVNELKSKNVVNERKISEIFTHLPEVAQEKYLIDLLTARPSLAFDQNASVYLMSYRRAWSEAVTQAVAETICHNIRKGDLQPWRWDRLLVGIAPCFHPKLLKKSIDMIGSELSRSKEGDKSVEKLLTILQFRMDMIESFQP